MEFFFLVWIVGFIIALPLATWYQLKVERQITLSDIGILLLISVLWPVTLWLFIIEMVKEYANKPLIKLKKLEKEKK